MHPSRPPSIILHMDTLTHTTEEVRDILRSEVTNAMHDVLTVDWNSPRVRAEQVNGLILRLEQRIMNRLQETGDTPGEATHYALWVNGERTAMVRRWEDGTMEICTREDSGGIWGAPIIVKKEGQ